MFGIDAATWNTVWPSLILIIGMTGAMVWAGVKAYRLIQES